MKTKLQIFSTEHLKNFFINLEDFFELNIKNFDELESSFDQNNLSVLFLDNQSKVDDKILKKISKNENFLFVCKDFSVFQNLSFVKKNMLNSPVSVNRLVDVVNNIVNTKKHIFNNVELCNHTITNKKTNEKIHLTHVENHILLKLFKEKNVKKKLIERDVLEIKQELNTSSMDSHLNRIRKKLKKISSCITISSKDKYVCLEIINPDK